MCSAARICDRLEGRPRPAASDPHGGTTFTLAVGDSVPFGLITMSPFQDSPPSTQVISSRPDWLTVIAIAVVAYGVVSIVHEGLGHGGACLAMGGQPQLVTSMQFQ